MAGALGCGYWLINAVLPSVGTQGPPGLIPVAPRWGRLDESSHPASLIQEDSERKHQEQMNRACGIVLVPVMPSDSQAEAGVVVVRAGRHTSGSVGAVGGRTD